MKTWLITGCSSGIGKGIAKAVLESGDQAIVTARNKDKVMDIVEAYPETALAVSLDVCSQDSIKNAVKEAYDKLADEVLSVGDFLFQQKCEKRMKELMAGGTTVILVSHSIEQIERMCSKVAWLSHGHLKMNGDTETVCAAYKATQRGEA